MPQPQVEKIRLTRYEIERELLDEVETWPSDVLIGWVKDTMAPMLEELTIEELLDDYSVRIDDEVEVEVI